MLFARILGLSIGLCLTIGVQAQSSKAGEQPHAPQEKQHAASLPHAAKSPGPFDSLTEFSATMVGSLMGNVDETKVYRSGNLMRTGMWNNVDYFVTDLVTDDSYAVHPKSKRCGYQRKAVLQTFPFAFFRPGYKVERTPAGEGVADGHHCHIESVVRVGPSGGEAHVRFWEADDLNGFPVKIEVDRPGGRFVTIAYKDITLGPPDPTVFERPKNCAPALKSRKHDSK